MPHLSRRLLLATPALLPGAALAQTDAGRPVRIMVGFPPGGGVDILARLLAPRLAERLRQPFVVENRPGANGNIAMEAVLAAGADGQTLLYANVGNIAMTNALYRNLSFDAVRDFVPIGQAIESFSVIAVNADLPVRSAGELIALARAQPGRLNGASAGAGGPIHLALEMFKRQFNLDIVHVPYRGAAPAIQDLAAGQVQMIIDTYGAMRPAVEAGRIRVLAAAAPARLAILPNVPTTAEGGAPGFISASWQMLVAPRGTPQPLLDRYEAAMRAVMAEPALVELINQQGVSVRFRGQAEAAAFMASERDLWTGVIRAANITLD